MANAAQFTGSASAIYDPQQAAEQSTADAAHTNTLTGLSAADAKIDPQYATAFKTAADARAAEAAKTDFTYSNALDGNMSGLHDNATIQQGNKYQDEVRQLAAGEAQAHTDITTQTNQENTSYGALRSSIASKYAGLKAGYIQDSLDKANAAELQTELTREQIASQERMAQLQASSYAANNHAPAASTRDQYNNDLSAIEQGLKSYQGSGYKGPAPSTRGATANELIQKYGGVISPQEINAYTKQLFGRYYIG